MFLPLAITIFTALQYRKEPTLQLVWIALWSCFFYAYWKPKYLLLLMFSVFVNYYIAGKLIERRDKAIFIFGILFNILVIFYFKYLGFIKENFNFIMSSHLKIHHIALPLGISFITFQKIAYLCDVYKGKIKERNFLRFLVFISFFPQLIAGPIVHYNQLMPQFPHHKTKCLRFDYLSKGISLFIIGLFKKVILADTVATYADPAFSAAMASVKLTFIEGWIGISAYTLQIYFDFSGYSDMAIGLACMFGIKLPVNFNSPYKANNIIDFWRRWHITLSSFLRDYVYIPLGGNRHGQFRKMINLMATMLIGGLWHGANWTFVLWGAIHGGLLSINHVWEQIIGEDRIHVLRKSYFMTLISRAFTFIFVMLAWVFFRMPSYAGVKFMMTGLFGQNGFLISQDSYLIHIVNRLTMITANYGLVIENPLILPVGFITFLLFLVMALPNSQELMRYPRSNITNNLLKLLVWRPRLAYLFGTISMLYTCLIMMSDFNFKPFAYFAF